jgi:hypothetical protein
MRPALARLIETLPAVFAVGTLGVVVLLAVLGSGGLVPVAAAVGWLLLTPLSALLVYVLGVTDDAESAGVPESVLDDVSESGTDTLSGDATAESGASPDDDPLATLRNRYARGEIDEVEFEQRLERLLETEDVDLPPGATLDVDDGSAATRDSDRKTSDADEPVREREPARER